MKKQKSHLILAVVVFIMCSFFGFYIASQKRLWNDELYTLLVSVNQTSYFKMLIGKIPEGSVSPLFYMVQKGLCDLFNYVSPLEWTQGKWEFIHPFSQIFLRISSVVFMALSIAGTFHFFLKRYSVFWAIYSILVSISSYMILSFWAEARPYALWVCLSTFQILVFLKILQTQKKNVVQNSVLLAINFGLSLTVTISVLQIFLVSVFLFIWKRVNLKYLLWNLLPIFICIFYQTQAPRYKFWFHDGVLELITASIPKDRLILILIYVMCLLVTSFVMKKESMEKLGLCKLSLIDRKFSYGGLVLLGSFVLFAGLILFYFKLFESGSTEGFQIANRYFIFLTPIGVIVTIFASIHLCQMAKKLPLRVFFLSVIFIFLIFRMYKSFLLFNHF